MNCVRSIKSITNITIHIYLNLNVSYCSAERMLLRIVVFLQRISYSVHFFRMKTRRRKKVALFVVYNTYHVSVLQVCIVGQQFLHHLNMTLLGGRNQCGPAILWMSQKKHKAFKNHMPGRSCFLT